MGRGGVLGTLALDPGVRGIIAPGPAVGEKAWKPSVGKLEREYRTGYFYLKCTERFQFKFTFYNSNSPIFIHVIKFVPTMNRIERIV